jgi:hypothetical protein
MIAGQGTGKANEEIEQSVLDPVRRADRCNLRDVE